jgi:hypothetical protein
MTRYLTSILAVIIAVGAFAFTTPAKNLSMVTFNYNPPTLNDYSQTSVQKTSNWAPGSEQCSDDLNRACSLQVPSEKTINGGTKLGPDVTITATQGGVSGAYYVTGGANVSNIHNKD